MPARFTPFACWLAGLSLAASAACSVDTERYRFVDEDSFDAGASGCANLACTECRRGFERGEQGCVEVDECAQQQDDCDDAPEACQNRDQGRGFICECPAGYEGNGIGEEGCRGTEPCPEGTIDLKGDASECYRPYQAIALGERHSCGLRGGRLYCWGEGELGRLGVGDEAQLEAVTRPLRVGEQSDWQAVTAGGQHTCGVRAGALVCWGDNAQGQLGTGVAEGSTDAPAAVGEESGWTAVSAGDAHSCGLRDELLFCWGDNAVGQAGLAARERANEPVRVGDGAGWSALSAGVRHSCGVRAGAVFCWGDNQQGQLGAGPATGQRAPLPVGMDTDWTALSAGGTGSCGLRGGALYCWGTAAGGAPREAPARVGDGDDWTQVALGESHACGLRGGLLYCWGDNAAGQLGLGDRQARDLPSRVGEGEDWELIAAGRGHSCGVRAGLLYCWGDNARGQLGTRDREPRDAPALVR